MNHEENRLKTIKQIRNDFFTKIPNLYYNFKNFSISKYYKIITSKKYLNYSNRRISNKIVPFIDNAKIKLQRKSFAEKILSTKELGYEVIYIDESGFNMKIQKNYIWNKRNKQMNLKFINKKSRNISLCAAISRNQIFGLQINLLPFKGDNFYYFLSQFINLYDLQKINVCFVMDNCKIHKAKEYFNMFYKHLNIIFLPPYSPRLNIIEFFLQI